MLKSFASLLVPGVLAVVGIMAVVIWTGMGPTQLLKARLPGMDDVPAAGPPKMTPRPVLGEPISGPGKPSPLAGAWPWFRGTNRDAVGKSEIPLARTWPKNGPEKLWEIELGEGYAAAAISNGRVYVLDHVHDEPIDPLRALSPQDRETLASALISASPEKFDLLDPFLKKLFPPKGSDANDPERGLTEPEFLAVEAVLKKYLSGERDLLVHALRQNALDDIDNSADVMRCLSFDDGREIWRNGYRVIVPRHHGRSRTIPAVIGKYVVSFGPKCHAACWDAETGKGLWLRDLAIDDGATVPPWYAGQCPLIDEITDRLVLAPGGKAMLTALDYKTGKVLWESPNPHGWVMTHTSIMPMEFAGRRMYVYCGKGGVAGVAADSGQILWETDDWKVSMATCPSPVAVGEGKIFFCGGYNSGSLMLQLAEENGKIIPRTLFRLSAKQFSSEQQTPVLWKGNLYGIRQHDKQLVCLDLEGKERWNSGHDKFGSAPYIIADGLIYVLNDEGRLTMAEAAPEGYRPLAHAEIFENGFDSWGPMAMAAGRLIVRDMTRMACLKVSDK